MIFGAISMGEALIRIVYSAGLDSSWWPAGAFGCDVALISATALCEGSRSAPAASPAPFRNRLLESADFSMTFSLGVFECVEAEPTKYWLATLSAHTTLAALVKLARRRWIIERDQELKQELGLGQLRRPRLARISSSRQLVCCRLRLLGSRKKPFSPSAHAGRLDLRAPEFPPEFEPRGSPRAGRTS